MTAEKAVKAMTGDKAIAITVGELGMNVAPKGMQPAETILILQTCANLIQQKMMEDSNLIMPAANAPNFNQ